MSGRGPETSEQTVPVEPPVHVEVFPTHYMTMWKADSLAQFLTALGAVDRVPPTASTVVDDSSTVGREQQSVADIEATETVRYLRVEPDTPWTVSWEQRTSPVVSVSGTPPPALCRQLHTRTTDCEEWSDDEVDSLVHALPEQRGSDDGMGQ
ncbi:MAG: hypothetical protein J07HX64_01736 [halophilic archaeon J07HX64]|nr:MAG: hypothetical protein J07HX64_01736 [halophilic archaeon J07HX64]